jgi:hypothetical protein
MVSACGVMLNMSVVKSISAGRTSNEYGIPSTILVSYINGDFEELDVDCSPENAIKELFEGIR